ncbi:MAG: ribosomal subunit interface protein [Candidatus Magasanikbacteria bacterium RIFCSPHIGHO2_01_FULL_47_8]|uniref:Ribosomal subunit interface protein n=1 Tax=Candidatus Magasanikbacteria bacterium RIFCSPHIGHO2_01_FULL_47_8 TaxID=1798673 RepID=A0A1F6MCS5_9BACT|nr:MAG: ribosomal subunit interface protein [Candidatus Magasanikbacteria bacterium RIFCSPHIGHO2_01_FULL_47_8]
MHIAITAKGTKLTDAIENYVEKKLGGLEKFFPDIIRAEVVVGMETHHHLKGKVFFVECKFAVPGHDVFAKKTAEGVYEAIDLLHDHLKIELEKHKAKLRNRTSKENVARRNNKEYRSEE